jgi:hypothetical protein
MRALKTCEPAIKRASELKTAFDQWRRFLSIAYGRFDDSPGMFLVHTYLSVFSKLLAFAVVTRKSVDSDDVLKGILSGSIFEEKLLVERFVEDDFFHWVVLPEHFKLLKPMFRELNHRIAEYDFSEVKEDILKGVYQELIDLETRHALGEYFTPDWLCEKIIDELPIEKNSFILDPACGSGSFLRAAIAHLRANHPRMTAEELSAQISGIDIHPLSVQIAKTTILLALNDLIKKAKKPITLHIYLANSLLVPEETADLFKSTFKVSIDNKLYALNISGGVNQQVFDHLIGLCDELVSRFSKTLERKQFVDLIENGMPKGHSRDLPNQLHDVYVALKAAKDSGRDSIWKFILQNSYKPVFLKNRFDIVVGNPPWLTYADISNADYQAEIKRLADTYNVTPTNKANMPHLEIAAVFFAHSANYFLKPSGELAFVLPRSFISADQHEKIRAGETRGLKLKAVWDLVDVTPLFNVPSSVFFANVTINKKISNKIPDSGIKGLSFSGRLGKSQLHWNEAKKKITIENIRWHYTQLLGGKSKSRSALTRERNESLVGRNAYFEYFKQGATIMPRSFYFVEQDGETEESDFHDHVLVFRADPAVVREAKAPWNELSISGRIEGRFVFRTAISKNVLPFVLLNPLLVVLPVEISDDAEGHKHFTFVTSTELLKSGDKFASQWFAKAERLWNEHKTERAEQSEMTYINRLDFQRGISDQNPDTRYLVIYTSSATDACAAVVDRSKFDAPFVVEHKTYWCAAKSLDEAHFLAAYLNSGYANEKIKDFQSRGLFGPRDIHKTIVKLPFPRFDSKNDDHCALAKAGAKCEKEAAKFIKASGAADLEARSLGRIRSKVREHITEGLKEIDRLVEKLSTSSSDAAARSSGRGRSRRMSGMPRLFN